MTRILFRCDAGPTIGSGHVMRCLAVAEALIDAGCRCVFAVAELPTTLKSRLAEAGVAVHRLDQDHPQALRSLNADLYVLDGYGFDETYRIELAGLGRPVVAFDDMADRTLLAADLVINAGAAATNLPYDRIAPGARLLLGSTYAPLRREFRQALRRPLPPPAQRNRILISFGGSDPLGLTVPVTLALLREPEQPPLDVVVSRPMPGLEQIAELSKARLHLDCRHMGQLMRDCGLAISAAGGTLAELAVMQVPTLAVVVANNQVASTTSLATQGQPVVDGRRLDAVDAIVGLAMTLWQDADRRAAMIASNPPRSDGMRPDGMGPDGMGAVRIARAIMDLLAL